MTGEAIANTIKQNLTTELKTLNKMDAESIKDERYKNSDHLVDLKNQQLLNTTK